AALDGNEAAALQLGRDFAAHVLVLGKVVWDNTLDNSSRTTQSRTADVSLRAIRLDAGKAVASAHGRGSAVDGDGRVAAARALRHAINAIVQHSEFAGALLNNWEEEPWSSLSYFEPDPGSPGAVLMHAKPQGAPALAIVRTDVRPSPGLSHRGAGVLRRSPGAGVANDVRVEGFVMGRVASVLVEGQKAELTPLPMSEARRLGIEPAAHRFAATLSLPSNQETITVSAAAPNGEASTAQAVPRIAQKWAVIVGISNYRSDQIGDLHHAARDAQAVHDFLRSPAAGPFEPDHILLLKDELATTRAIREALFVFLQKAGPADLVLIYFAGHSASDPMRPDNLYLLSHDAQPDALASTALPMWDVKTALRRRIRAERVIVLADARHQAGLGNPIHRAFADLFTPSRRLLLTAANDQEASHEDTRAGSGQGVFTYSLIEGLKGAADADRNGIVTFIEVADYVSGKVRLETSGKQSPMRAGLGDVPLAEVSTTPIVQSCQGLTCYYDRPARK
ncbi:MAG: caspase family protein, partial [Longimicrobiales bacterium]